MIRNINFTKSNGQYVSENIQLTNGTACVHLEFSGKSRNRCITLLQSIDGNVFVPFDYNSYVSAAWEKNISGGISGQYIRIECTAEPVVAKYLEAE